MQHLYVPRYLLIPSSNTETIIIYHSANPPPAKLQLKYFDIKGAAETCRVLLAFGGEDYDDCRYQIDPTTFKSEEFLKAKESGDLKMNLNRAPVLITPDGKTIGQSKAIERYLARRFGLWAIVRKMKQLLIV